MPDITLTTTAPNAAKLQTMVDFYNADHRTTFTIKQWIIEMVRQQYKLWNTERLAASVPDSDEVSVT